jgi:hypothetical protein
MDVRRTPIRFIIRATEPQRHDVLAYPSLIGDRRMAQAADAVRLSKQQYAVRL